MSEETVSIDFIVVTYRPDGRQYRQNCIEVAPNPDLLVRVEVPADMVVEQDKFKVITPQGLRYIVNVFDEIFKDESKPQDDEDWEGDESDDEWDEAAPAESTTEDDDWEDVQEEDETWNEDEEEW